MKDPKLTQRAALDFLLKPWMKFVVARRLVCALDSCFGTDHGMRVVRCVGWAESWLAQWAGGMASEPWGRS